MRPLLLAFALLLPFPSLAVASHVYQTGTLVNIGAPIEEYTGYAVQVENILYAASCAGGWAHSCDTDFLINAPVKLRIDGDYLYLVRKNGKELKLHIVQRRLIGPATPPVEN